MKTLTLIFLIISLSLVGCFPTQQLALTDFSREPIKLPFKVENLSIVDKRDTLLAMNWKVPMVAVKTRQWKGNPPLSATNKSDIERIISQSSTENGIPVNIEFSVIEGLCELNTSWKAVSEHAKFQGEIQLEIPSRDLFFTSYAEMTYDNPTLNGTEQGTMKLYNQAVKNVTHLLLKQIKEEVNVDEE